MRRLMCIRRVVFFVQDFGPDPVPGEASPAVATVPVRFKLAIPEDVDRYAADLLAVGVEPAEARRRLTVGDIGYFGVVGDRLVHQSWETSQQPQVDEIGMRLILAPGETSSYGTVTTPGWRGHRIQPASFAFRIQSRRARGVRRTYSWVSGDNAANLRVHAGRGSRRLAVVWTLRVLGMRHPRVLWVNPPGALPLAPANTD